MCDDPLLPDSHPDARWRTDTAGGAGWLVVTEWAERQNGEYRTPYPTLGPAYHEALQLACLRGVRAVRVIARGKETDPVVTYDRTDNVFRTHRDDIRADEQRRTQVDLAGAGLRWVSGPLTREQARTMCAAVAVCGNTSLERHTHHALALTCAAGLIRFEGTRWRLTHAGEDVLSSGPSPPAIADVDDADGRIPPQARPRL